MHTKCLRQSLAQSKDSVTLADSGKDARLSLTPSISFLSLSFGSTFNMGTDSTLPSPLQNDHDHLSHSISWSPPNWSPTSFLVPFRQFSEQSAHSVKIYEHSSPLHCPKSLVVFHLQRLSSMPHPSPPSSCLNSYNSPSHTQQRFYPLPNSSQAPLSPFSTRPRLWPIKT